MSTRTLEADLSVPTRQPASFWRIPPLPAVIRLPDGLAQRDIPTWLNRLAIFGGFFNAHAVFGFITLSGPLNAMNGVVSLGGPTIGAIPFVVLLAVYLIMQELPAGLARLNTQLSVRNSR